VSLISLLALPRLVTGQWDLENRVSDPTTAGFDAGEKDDEQVGVDIYERRAASVFAKLEAIESRHS
jgi:hypothetical protein